MLRVCPLLLFVLTPALPSQPPQVFEADGVISRLEPGRVLIKKYAGPTGWLALDAKSAITIDGKPARPGDLQPGMRFQATYNRQAVCVTFAVTTPVKRPEPLEFGKLEVGQVGTIPEADIWLSFIVKRIVSGTDTLVAPVSAERRTNKLGQTIVGIQREGRPFIVRGVPNAGLADNAKMPLSGLFRVTSTISIPHPAGDRTYFVLEPVK